MDDLKKSKDEVAYFMRRLYGHGLTTTSGGNISMRYSKSEILITPSSSDKGRMAGREIGIMRIDGVPVTKFKPSIESSMHLNIYRLRDDVHAVVHAHPVTASAFSAGNAEIDCTLLSESYAILGEIAYAPYHLMGSDALARAVSGALQNANCAVMRNHGIITVGKNLLEAFDRLEVLEAAARMTLITSGFPCGKRKRLNSRHLLEIDSFMGRKNK